MANERRESGRGEVKEERRGKRGEGERERENRI